MKLRWHAEARAEADAPAAFYNAGQRLLLRNPYLRANLSAVSALSIHISMDMYRKLCFSIHVSCKNTTP
jgi:hypothetical protein